MDIVIQASLRTLQKTQYILDKLSDAQFCNASVSPYYSSIGSHIRHILDFYECIFNVNSKNQVDLTARPRNKEIESKCDCAKGYLDLISNKLKTLDFEMQKNISVIDDLGLGTIEMTYTYEALFAQANSHTIHHYAIINYILDRLGILMGDENFGYNPTTPNQTTIN